MYEIAKIKQLDPPSRFLPLKVICEQVITGAHSCGIEIVHKLDATDYANFLNERKQIVEQQLKEIKEKKEARMLRTG